MFMRMPLRMAEPAIGCYQHPMKVLCVHPSGLMYNEIFLRLEPLGVELVAAAVRAAGHDVRLLDLQVASHRDYFRLVEEFRPRRRAVRHELPRERPRGRGPVQARRSGAGRSCSTCVGGHSASFTSRELLDQGDARRHRLRRTRRGRGDRAAPARGVARDDPGGLHRIAGVMTLDGEGPPPAMIHTLDDLRPARDLLRHRNKYFIGVLDPAASIEFSRGCPWDCSFCSAWTFYGRSYRQIAPERCAEDLASIREPGVFIVDDVAFIHAEHGHAIADAIERRGIRKRYYLETRGDVLLRNKDVFARWKRLGLEYMFLGLEAIDAAGLEAFRKRVSLDKNFEALESARSLGITVAVNIIADPDWDEARFAVIREWALSVPEIVNVSVNTPYPGTESFVTNARTFTTRDYRLFDIQHAVLPTKLPLDRFYAELVKTQQVLNRKHLGARAAARDRGDLGAPAAEGADELPPDAVALQQRLQPGAAAGRSRAPGQTYDDDAAAGGAREPVQRRRLFVLQPNSRAAGMNLADHRRRREVHLAALDGLGRALRALRHPVDVAAEARLVDQRAVQHGAPVAGHRREHDRLADLGIARAVDPRLLGVDVRAVAARHLRRHRERDQILGLGIERGAAVEQDRLDLAPCAGHRLERDHLHERRHHAERVRHVLKRRLRIGDGCGGRRRPAGSCSRTGASW